MGEGVVCSSVITQKTMEEEEGGRGCKKYYKQENISKYYRNKDINCGITEEIIHVLINVL